MANFKSFVQIKEYYQKKRKLHIVIFMKTIDNFKKQIVIKKKLRQKNKKILHEHFISIETKEGIPLKENKQTNKQK